MLIYTYTSGNFYFIYKIIKCLSTWHFFVLSLVLRGPGRLVDPLFMHKLIPQQLSEGQKRLPNHIKTSADNYQKFRYVDTASTGSDKSKWQEMRDKKQAQFMTNWIYNNWFDIWRAFLLQYRQYMQASQVSGKNLYTGYIPLSPRPHPKS